MTCSNCGNDCDPRSSPLALFEGAVRVATICVSCQQGVKVAKVVVSREKETSPWGYEGYLPAASGFSFSG